MKNDMTVGLPSMRCAGPFFFGSPALASRDTILQEPTPVASAAMPTKARLLSVWSSILHPFSVKEILLAPRKPAYCQHVRHP